MTPAPYRIDTHMHGRDGSQSYKTTVAKVLALARDQGIEKIIDMPNTSPPILTEEDVVRRLTLVPQYRQGDYFVNMLVTPQQTQLQAALDAYKKQKQIAGLKAYLGPSTGNYDVNGPDQPNVMAQLHRFPGVLVVHAEDKRFMDDSKYDRRNPITHAQLCRPKEAEIQSVQGLLDLVDRTGYDGKILFAHISTPEAVDLINKARNDGKVNAAIEVTPHHIMWDWSQLERPDGVLFKMNPALRSPEDVAALQARVVAGKVDVLGTDHATHHWDEKWLPDAGKSPPSGYPSLGIYRFTTDTFMPGLGMSSEQIDAMTYWNIVELYEGRVK